MNQAFENWLSVAKARVKEKTSIFTDKEKQKLKLDYPERLLTVVPRFLQTPEDAEEFKIHTDAIIAALPETTNIFKANLVTYETLIKESRKVYSKKYKLIQKGVYQALFMSIGLSIGTSFGVTLKKIGIFMPLGLSFGIFLGAYLESKAAKEGRVL